MLLCPHAVIHLIVFWSWHFIPQGHCHPRIVEALVKQASTLNLASRAFSTDSLGEFAQYITNYFGYDKVLPMVREYHAAL